MNLVELVTSGAYVLKFQQSTPKLISHVFTSNISQVSHYQKRLFKTKVKVDCSNQPNISISQNDHKSKSSDNAILKSYHHPRSYGCQCWMALR